MNCLEFRRHKLADPQRLPQAAQTHAQACASCAEFARTQDLFEQTLSDAARVPSDAALASRVLLRRQLKHASERRMYARAALLLLAFAFVFGAGWRTFGPGAKLIAATAAHVAHEPSALRANERRSSEELADALARSGVKLTHALDADISYIHDCPVPGGLGKHIVLRSAEGTITLLTMPNQKIFMRQTKLHNGYFVALLPCKHGVVALVARSKAELAAMEARLSKHVQWNA